MLSHPLATAPVLVTGGTGTLGHLVVPRLRADGPEDSGGPSAEESSLHVIPEE